MMEENGAAQPGVTSESGRYFAAFPIALLAYVVNDREEFLILRRPGKSRWEIPAGVLEPREAPVEGMRRELREELGDAAQLGLRGLVHAVPIRFDRQIPQLVSLGFLVAYAGGELVPADDIAGAELAWQPLESLLARGDIEVPNDLNHFRTARTLYRCPATEGL